jgi:hypothetical protein
VTDWHVGQEAWVCSAALPCEISISSWHGRLCCAGRGVLRHGRTDEGQNAATPENRREPLFQGCHVIM